MKLKNTPFGEADILIAKTDMSKWACIACDQFTSDENYWNSVYECVGDFPSTANLILPEVFLGDDDKKRVDKINRNMQTYIDSDIFTEYKDAMIFVERTLPNGAVRYGIVGKTDLCEYDYNKGSQSVVRATEGTVISRIPPRVAVRKSAPLELPHIMLLIDDVNKTVIEPLKNANLKVLYDFDLMMGGGHIVGRLIPGDKISEIKKAIESLADKLDEGSVLIAVGDGNHSLATAKECYRLNPTEKNRYALTELVNIHDSALVFEPIYRVVFNCDVEDFISYALANMPKGDKRVEYLSKTKSGQIYVSGLACGTVQDVIDSYISAHPNVKCDYIHGEKEARAFAQQDNTVAFVYGGIDKSELFDYVGKHGSLPRKTFSMGQAESKRYYIEARLIDKG